MSVYLELRQPWWVVKGPWYNGIKKCGSDVYDSHQFERSNQDEFTCYKSFSVESRIFTDLPVELFEEYAGLFVEKTTDALITSLSHAESIHSLGLSMSVTLQQP